ncbi:GMP synthase family protein [Mizugakiibacter sediminis]|uniref:GMP synthase family protein n=1 Tax=Mizugakiibacter sediminis TaxID=1475481 RepID=A0A0K8QMT7_9GAMM|nr:glutamine amidotransferase [Mizugakiibacter sediminis]GAP65742.1 GMP synthase family protein [Mizugakiibacter sediminis]
MKPLLIVQTGSAPEPICARLGDFPHWFRLALGVHPRRLRVVRVDRDEALPPPRMCAGAVITGSAAMVTERLPWSERTAGWIRDAMDAALPLLGVCYGHQLMAHALGGRVDWLPGGREIGTQRLELLPGAADDPLARALPPVFRAHTTHEQSVLEPPAGARVLARSARDPHQMLRYGERAFSTQFHPEFSAQAMAAYIRRRAAKLREEGLDVPRLLREVGPTPHARRLLEVTGSDWAGAAA